MGLSNLATKTILPGNGSDVAFTIAQDVISDVDVETEVWIRDDSTSPVTETLQVDPTNYSISGTTVTFVTAPAATDVVLIIRNMPKTQTISLGPSTDPQPEVQELTFDKIAATLQELKEEVGRCAKIMASCTETLTDMDPVDTYALIFDSLGNIVPTPLTTTDATLASQAEAEAGTENTKYMSSLRTDQAITVRLAVLQTVTSVTTTHTAATTDAVILADSSGGAYTITLYAASGNSGREILIKKTTSDTTSITIDGSGAETIDGNTTETLDIQYESIKLVCDGSNWHIIEHDIPPIYAKYTAALTSAVPSFGTKFDFATSVEDDLSIVTTGAAWKCTPPKVGVYELKAQVEVTGSIVNEFTATFSEYDPIAGSGGSIASNTVPQEVAAAASHAVDCFVKYRVPLKGDYIQFSVSESNNGASFSGGAALQWVEIRFLHK